MVSEACFIFYYYFILFFSSFFLCVRVEEEETTKEKTAKVKSGIFFPVRRERDRIGPREVRFSKRALSAAALPALALFAPPRLKNREWAEPEAAGRVMSTRAHLITFAIFFFHFFFFSLFPFFLINNFSPQRALEARETIIIIVIIIIGLRMENNTARRPNRCLVGISSVGGKSRGNFFTIIFF